MSEISVIIVTKDNSRYIDALMMSLFCQFERDIKIIFVDDASGDDTVDVITRYAKFDKRIEIIQNDKSVGGIKCCKIGLEKVYTPYAILFNACKYMYFCQGYLRELLINIKKYNTDFVYSVCYMSDAPICKTLPLYKINVSSFIGKEVFSHFDLDKNILMSMYLYPWAKLFDTQFLREMNFDLSEEPFGLECMLKANKISHELYLSCNQCARKVDLQKPNVIIEQKENRDILEKYDCFERYKNSYIAHKMFSIWQAVLQAPSEAKPTMFEDMKKEFSDERFEQYDFGMLRKNQLYWMIGDLENMQYEDFVAKYIRK